MPSAFPIAAPLAERPTVGPRDVYMMGRMMRATPSLLAAALAALVATAAPASATDAPSPVEAWLADPTLLFEAEDVDLDDFRYLARPVVVFADSPLDPAFIEQMEEIASEPERLVERDVVVIVDTDPDARTELRTRLRPRGFMLALIAKDGQVNLRKPLPWTVRELSRSIDKMPIRQREISER